MKSIFSKARCILTGALLILSVNMTSAQNQYPEGSPVAINGKLKVENGQLVNECGYPTQLRGMSTHGLAWYRNTYNESSIKAMVEDWNISIFRIAVYTHENAGYCKEQGESGYASWFTRENCHDKVNELVDLCAKYGIYCLIDWHVLNEGSGNPMFTIEWAKQFWEYMSKQHAGKKHVLYEICNEPNGATGTWTNIKKFANTIIPLIRNNDPNTVIICGTPSWSQNVDDPADDPLAYDNIMYTLHFYSGSHNSTLRKIANYALGKGVALFVTEFGTSLASGGGGVYTAECDRWFDWMNQNNISWCNWSFCDKDETSAALVVGSSSKQEWNNTTKSGSYIKSKLLENYKDSFVACTDTTPYYVSPVESPDVPEKEPEKISDDTTSVKDYDLSLDVKIYPNPSEDGSFSVEAPFEVQKVVLTDLNGREIEVFESNSTNYITHNLMKGIYLVKVYGSKFVTVKRFVKN